MNPLVVDMARIPLFAGLSDPDLSALAARFEIQDFEVGHLPTMVGQHGYSFFVVVRGAARVEVDGQVVEMLRPGSFFGEMAFFAPQSRRTATVVPETTFRVLSQFGTDFRWMQHKYPAVAERIKAKFDEHRGRDEMRDHG